MGHGKHALTERVVQLVRTVCGAVDSIKVVECVINADRLRADDLAEVPATPRCFAVGIPFSIYPGLKPLRLAAYLTRLMFDLGLNVSRVPPLQLLLHLYSTRQIGRVIKLIRKHWTGDVVIALVSVDGREECLNDLERNLISVCGCRPGRTRVSRAGLDSLRRIYGGGLGALDKDPEKDLLNAVAYSVIKMLRKAS